jgi:hypothetical protein
MSDDFLISKALEIYKEYGPESFHGADVDNSVAGSLLALLYHSPRWATEAAVRNALKRLKKRPKR